MVAICVLLLLQDCKSIKNSYNTYFSHFQSFLKKDFHNRNNEIKILRSNSSFLL